MADLCDVYTPCKAANTAFRQQPYTASQLFDWRCAAPFESETSVCTLVPTNPEYYAGGFAVGGTKAQPNALQER